MGERSFMRQPRVSVEETGLPEPSCFLWNVVVTAKDHERRHLARLVKRLGDFCWTPFLGVLVGRVGRRGHAGAIHSQLPEQKLDHVV